MNELKQVENETSQINSVLLEALKLAYECAARVGYLNAGLSTDNLILIERAIKTADKDYKYQSIIHEGQETNG